MINKGSGSTGRELLLSLVSDNIQGVPIKNNPLGKIHYHSYCNRFFHQSHTLPTEEDSHHIHSKFHYNICCGLEITTILT